MKADLRPWLLNCERREALLALYNGDDGRYVPVWITEELDQLGLLRTAADGSRCLTRHGRLLAYNIAEFGIQMGSQRMASTLQSLKIARSSVVLDIGCGGGQSLFSLVDREPSLALGVDFERGNLEIARSFATAFPMRNGRFAFQQGDGSYLPFKSSSVDVVICRNVLQYLEIRKAFEETARVLKPGGRVFIHALGLRSFVMQVVKADIAGKIWALFGLVNGLVFFLTGRQFTIPYRDHRLRAAFLTPRGLRELKTLGFDIHSFDVNPAGYYTVVAEKRAEH